MPSALRPAVQSLTFRALRRGYWACAIIDAHIDKAPSNHVFNLIWVTIALLKGTNWDPAYHDHTLVSEAVNACKLDKKLIYAKGLVNAVLRKIVGSKSLLDDFPEGDFPSYPDWWIEKLTKSYGDGAHAVIASSMTPPPMTLRLNQRILKDAESISKYKNEILKLGIGVSQISEVAGIKLENAFQLTEPLPVESIPGFAEGYFSVQDACAQVAGALLGDQSGKRVLDACAAPGGKACHILERGEAQLDALEIDSKRAIRIEENLARLRLNGRVIVGDALIPTWWDGRLYDTIVADVPCSASGIVRRHPDIPYLREESDIQQLQFLQREILVALWPSLKPGGRLLYVTCSVFPEEGELQAQWWLNKTKDAVRLEAPGQIFPTSCHDGFFYALFEKLNTSH